MSDQQTPENKNKRALMVAMALGLEFFGLSLAGVFGGYYLGGLMEQGALGAIFGFIATSTLWTWRLVSTKRHIL